MPNANLHPTMAAICATFSGLQSSIDQANKTAYIAALKLHDWDYEYSDDGRVWDAGRKSHRELLMLAKEFDPSYVVWNSYCPFAHKKPAPDHPILAQRIKELM